jgi:hypothetical protein
MATSSQPKERPSTTNKSKILPMMMMKMHRRLMTLLVFLLLTTAAVEVVAFRPSISSSGQRSLSSLQAQRKRTMTIVKEEERKAPTFDSFDFASSTNQWEFPSSDSTSPFQVSDNKRNGKATTIAVATMAGALLPLLPPSSWIK